MPLFITQQIVLFDHVISPGTVLREGEMRERALEQQGWGIYCEEEQLHWYVNADDDFYQWQSDFDDGISVVEYDDLTNDEEE